MPLTAASGLGATMACRLPTRVVRVGGLPCTMGCVSAGACLLLLSMVMMMVMQIMVTMMDTVMMMMMMVRPVMKMVLMMTSTPAIEINC